MKSKTAVKKYLAKFKKEMESDEQEEDFYKKLPCCDYRELEVSISLLEWVLD